MNANKLNLRQKKLIQQLAELKQKDQLIEPINPFPLGLMSYVIYLRSKFNLRFESLSDLEILTLAGYLGFQWNRSGVTKLYFVTDLGMSVLDDPHFITPADYDRYRNLHESLEFFDDISEQPPMDDSIQSLVTADFKYLTQTLKVLTTEVLPKQNLEKVTANINLTEKMIESKTGKCAETQEAIQLIGQQLLLAIRENGHTNQTQTAARALLVFSLWNQEITLQQGLAKGKG